jgi:HD-like signal output (HDOD) protein
MLDAGQFMQLKASGNLPSPKGPALKVMQLCQRDNVPLPEIARVLQIDPMMAGRILKLANSSAFGRQRTAMALTPDVLMSIGIQSMRQVVLAFSLVSENRNGQCSSFDYDMFWSHSAATGVATQLLSATTRVAPPADLFTVGLLANIGKLALAALHPARYAETLTRAGGQLSPALSALESKEFGFTHLDVAAAMMKDWGLPRLFADAVQFHESPELAGIDAGSRSEKLLNCVHLGARLADFCFEPESRRGEEFRALVPLALNLGIATEALTALGDQMLREWAEWGALLEISVHEVAPFATLSPAA